MAKECHNSSAPALHSLRSARQDNLGEKTSRSPIFVPITDTNSCKTEVGNLTNLVSTGQYSDSDDDSSVSSVDTADNDVVTKGRFSSICPELMMERPSCRARGSSTRTSSFILPSISDVSSISSGSSPADKTEQGRRNITYNVDCSPNRRVYAYVIEDSTYSSKNASPKAASTTHSSNSSKFMNNSSPLLRVERAENESSSGGASPASSRILAGAQANNASVTSPAAKDVSPAATVRYSSSFERHIEHDLLQQREQLVLLTREVRVPHVHIQVQEKTAEELIAHSTAVMRTTRNGQAVLRRNYGVQGVPSPTNTRLRAPFAVMSHHQRHGSGGAAGGATAQNSGAGAGHGATVRTLQRTGVASTAMIDNVEEYLGGLGCSKQGFAQPTMGNMLTTVAHRK